MISSSPKRGFTLVELVMAIVVASIVSIPLALMIQQHVFSLNDLQDDSMAVELARYDLERVKKTAYASISLGTTNFSNYQSYPYDITRTVSMQLGTSGAAESLKKIKVDVKKSGSSSVVFSLITYLGKNVSLGP